MSINSIPSRATVLNRFYKRLFDVRSRVDLEEYRYFLEQGKWKNGVCPFEVEWPYISIPNMINEKITRHYLTSELG